MSTCMDGIVYLRIIPTSHALIEHGRYHLLTYNSCKSCFNWTYITLDKWSCFKNCNQKGINIVFMSWTKSFQKENPSANRRKPISVNKSQNCFYHTYFFRVRVTIFAQKKNKINNKQKSNNKNNERYLPFNMNTTICHILKIMRFTLKIQPMGNKSQIILNQNF